MIGSLDYCPYIGEVELAVDGNWVLKGTVVLAQEITAYATFSEQLVYPKPLCTIFNVSCKLVSKTEYWHRMYPKVVCVCKNGLYIIYNNTSDDRGYAHLVKNNVSNEKKIY